MPESETLPTKPWWHRRPRHIHIWEDTGRQVFPPLRQFEATWMDSDELRDLIYGFTLLDQSCASCSDRRQLHFTGNVAAEVRSG